MKPSEPCILTINGGSSSIKFAVYPTVDRLKRTFYGTVDRIGMSGTNLTFHAPAIASAGKCSSASAYATSGTKNDTWPA